jgi:hypothetical protein
MMRLVRRCALDIQAEARYIRCRCGTAGWTHRGQGFGVPQKARRVRESCMDEPQHRDCLLLYIAPLRRYGRAMDLFAVPRSPCAIRHSPFGLPPRQPFCIEKEVGRGRSSLLDLVEANHTDEILPKTSIAGPCCWTESWKYGLLKRKCVSRK